MNQLFVRLLLLALCTAMLGAIAPARAERPRDGRAESPQIIDLHVRVEGTTATITWRTDVPTTSNLLHGLTPAYEAKPIGSAQLTTRHSLTVTGLTPGARYHYQAISEDGAGNRASSDDRTFVVPPLVQGAEAHAPDWADTTPEPGARSPRTSGAPAAAAIQSDTFNDTKLALFWTFVDPLGDAQLALDGVSAKIQVPAEVEHDPWRTGNNVPRLMQPAEDTDFEVEAKFDTLPYGDKTLQGIMVETADQSFLRFDVYSTRSGGVDTLNIFAASLVKDGDIFTNTQTYANTPIPSGEPIYLRVKRAGDTWTYSYSFDGASWTEAANFSYALSPAAVGVFAGNADSSPAFTASVDYFLNLADPLNDDPDPDLDTTPPTIYNIELETGLNQISVAWQTDEPATTRLDYGSTPSYGNVETGETATSVHEYTLDGLTPDTSYHLQITATDSAENIVTRTMVVSTNTAAAPAIDVWYGPEQYFGMRGRPQRWVNILGRVSDPDGVNQLFYTLNGSAPRALSIGPDSRRLAAKGDFNIDLLYEDLSIGTNTIAITAIDTAGFTATQTVAVEVAADRTWPLPYTADWGNTTTIDGAAQVVDGLWEITPAGLRPLAIGYDRLIALGDMAWHDYEVVVPITIHSFSDSKSAFDNPSLGPGVGVMVHWQGHFGPEDGWPDTQPYYGWRPFGALAWYRWSTAKQVYRLNIMRGDGTLGAEDGSEGTAPRQLELGTTYIFKLRAESREGASSIYSFKVWPADQPEPAEWDLVATGAATELREGSVVLVAHHTDATFGNVEVRSIQHTTLLPTIKRSS